MRSLSHTHIHTCASLRFWFIRNSVSLALTPLPMLTKFDISHLEWLFCARKRHTHMCPIERNRHRTSSCCSAADCYCVKNRIEFDKINRRKKCVRVWNGIESPPNKHNDIKSAESIWLSAHCLGFIFCFFVFGEIWPCISFSVSVCVSCLVVLCRFGWRKKGKREREESREKKTQFDRKINFECDFAGEISFLSLTNANWQLIVTKNAMWSLQHPIHRVQTKETMHRVQVSAGTPNTVSGWLTKLLWFAGDCIATIAWPKAAKIAFYANAVSYSLLGPCPRSNCWSWRRRIWYSIYSRSTFRPLDVWVSGKREKCRWNSIARTTRLFVFARIAETSSCFTENLLLFSRFFLQKKKNWSIWCWFMWIMPTHIRPIRIIRLHFRPAMVRTNRIHSINWRTRVRICSPHSRRRLPPIWISIWSRHKAIVDSPMCAKISHGIRANFDISHRMGDPVRVARRQTRYRPTPIR